MSPPTRAEWIEIARSPARGDCGRSPPTRAEWIEIASYIFNIQPCVSPPTRAEWIEIVPQYKYAHRLCVSAHTGGVD